MITNEEQLERVEQSVHTIKTLLKHSRKTMSAEAYALMARPWLLELQERERETLAYLAATNFRPQNRSRLVCRKRI